ncbi:MAG: DUF4442 domain-containing protein [Bacteroidales bacterium]|nr:DUF4442 domain-containing protein [Bacteroidales bacterium]
MNGDDIRKMAISNWKMKAFMLQNLPMAFLAGLRIITIDREQAQVGIPHKYLNKNPFKSMYFATQSMAAELSTGILAMAAVKDSDVAVSMLVLNMKASFTKKATSKIIFSSNDGKAIAEAIKRTLEDGEGHTIIATSIGKNTNGEVVSEFEFNWTFKRKK